MALGFGFNKAKVLSSAEKYVQQGKLQNAIGEYEKVARHDPKDLNVLNTIGDLYARLGQSERATSCFRRIGDIYAAEGFTVKAIAMYKKLTKLAPDSTDGLQKLAELYTQQGLYNDARQQYVVLADHWMKANDLENASRVFQKMLELDPENSAMQSKLADLYLRMGKRDDAKQIYFQAAESLYQRAALDAADEALGRILIIEPGNIHVLLKRAEIALDSGDASGARQHLERIPDLDSNPRALGVLLRAHLQTGNPAEAETVARELATRHKEISGILALADWMMSRGSCQQGLALYREFSSQLSIGKTGSLQRALESALHKVKDDAASLEIVRELYRKLGDKAHINESTELLAHALVQAGDLQRARDLYRDLVEAEPENPIHQQHYRQVLAKLGEDAAVRPLTEEEGSQALLVDELEISAPEVSQEYSEDVSEAIRCALTDAELLDSYNLPEKAVAKLEAVLPKAPRDPRLNQRLAALYAGAGRFAEAARCCDILESVYLEAGFPDQAIQYHDMAVKYHERSLAAPRPQPVAAPAAPAADLTVEPQPPAAAAPAAEISVEAEPPVAIEIEAPTLPSVVMEKPSAAVPVAAEESAPSPAPPVIGEIDLSEEWESQAVTAPPPPAPDIASLHARLAADAARAPEVQLESPDAELGIVGWEQPPATPPEVPPPAAEPKVAEPAVAAAEEDTITGLVSDLERSLDVDFAVREPVAAVATTPAAPSAAAPFPAAPAAAVAAQAPDEASSALAEMFAEFKEEAESGEQLEDPETHYNLGIAFREMGLMDEAIGELQKVCAAIDRGAAFPRTMQAYTWLAQSFVEKGVPDASFKWYQRALNIATDEQQRMSLHYDLAAAYEASGNRQAALQHFMEVYGSNIDFRDVAERIKALRS
jgi:tetratricopeptide (TPR) repeat protein